MESTKAAKKYQQIAAVWRQYKYYMESNKATTKNNKMLLSGNNFRPVFYHNPPEINRIKQPVPPQGIF